MKGDVIKLTFPAKPDYILAVRLAVSAVAERAGFSIEDIEDIKIASAEGCMLLLASGPEAMDIHITVQDGLQMDFEAAGQAKGQAENDETSELSQYLLEALVDRCEFIKQDDTIKGVSIFKKL